MVLLLLAPAPGLASTVPGLPDAIDVGVVATVEGGEVVFRLVVSDPESGPDCRLGAPVVQVRDWQSSGLDVRVRRASGPDHPCPPGGAVVLPLPFAGDPWEMPVPFTLGGTREVVTVRVDGCRATLTDDPFAPTVRLVDGSGAEPPLPPPGELTVGACGAGRTVAWRYPPALVGAARARAIPEERSVWQAEAWRDDATPDVFALVDEARSRAQAARARGDHRAAAEILERCPVTTPRAAADAIAAEAARAYLDAGLPERAAAAAERAVAAGSSDPWVLLALGDALAATGRVDGAMKAYTSAARP